jgi:hypothetical protein
LLLAEQAVHEVFPQRRRMRVVGGLERGASQVQKSGLREALEDHRVLA